MRFSSEIEVLESRTLFAGVILEATGRLGPLDTFMPVMASSIAAKLGGTANVPEYILSVNPDPSTGVLVPSIKHVDGTGLPATTTSGQIIVLIDYQSISANPSYSSTVIGASIADFMMNTPVDGVTLASLPIDEIALSRGAGILDGISKELGQAGVWVDQQTYLDPDTIGAQGDPAPTIYSNVAFVDDYWRNDGIQSPIGEGQPVSGAYNLNVAWLDGNDAGWGSAHEAPTGYYIGTIDQNATQSGLGPIYNSWYGNSSTMPARNATGFIYTSLVGVARPLSGVWSASGGTGTRTAAGQVGTQWGDITDLAVTSGGLATANNPIQVSYLQQDRGGADTVAYYLDTDRNPYNNFAATLGTSTLPQSAAITPQVQTVTLGNVSAGSYWLCAKITNAQGDVRYAYTSVNSQLTVQASGSISGRVVNDINGDGVFSTGDAGIAGRTVYIDLNQSGQFQSNDPSATTDDQGNYTISGLLPGVPFTVREVVPVGATETAAPSGTVVVSSGQTAMVADFATQQSATISGTVIITSGITSPNTDPNSGFTVMLIEHIHGAKSIKLLTTTDAGGNFVFTNLQSGARDTVQVVKRGGFKLAPHSKSIYTENISTGQVISGLTFSQVPILTTSRRHKAAR
jgi:hypothetical protein